MPEIHKLDNLARGQVHAARTTAQMFLHYLHLVNKRDQPYFAAMCNYIIENPLKWVQDDGYSDLFFFRDFKMKESKSGKKRLVKCTAYIPPIGT